MNTDIILYVIFTCPLLILVFQTEKLKQKKVFIAWICLAVFILISGLIIEKNSSNGIKGVNYFGSQMLLIFLIIQKIARNIYFKIFKREPEFGKFPKNKIDYIYTSLIVFGTMLLPFLLDSYVFQKL